MHNAIPIDRSMDQHQPQNTHITRIFDAYSSCNYIHVLSNIRKVFFLFRIECISVREAYSIQRTHTNLHRKIDDHKS